MRRLVRWTARGVGALLACLLVAVLVIHVLSERILGRSWDIEPVALSIPTDSGAMARGERLARLRGCPGCHERDLGGGVFDEAALLGRLVAPNLTERLRTLSVDELERAIRHGIGPDGRGLLGMPSAMFAHLADDDLADILAFLASRPRVERDLPTTTLRPLARLLIVLGAVEPEPLFIDHSAPHPEVAPDSGAARGEYLALTVCTECHGPHLEGDPSGRPPDLAVAASYTPEDFHRFMRTGLALGGRELELMSDVARSRFSLLTDDEIASLYGYLRARAEAR